MVRWSAPEIARQLAGNRWFARRPSTLRAALVEGGRVSHLGKGQWSHGEGDEATGLWAVLAGSLRLEASVGLERDVLLNVVGPGVILGQTAAFGGGPRLVTARAAEPATVLLIGDAALQAISAAHPSLWRSVSELVYGQLEAAVRFAAETLCLPPRARVAARLLSLTDEAGGSVRISQADLAEMTGLSRKSVNGHLNALQDQALVRLDYRGIEVLAPGRLRALVAPGDG